MPRLKRRADLRRKKINRRKKTMLAIYRRELKSYFTSVIACLFIAVTTLIAGIFFVYYNLSYGVSEMYSVYQCLLILVFTVPIFDYESNS